MQEFKQFLHEAHMQDDIKRNALDAVKTAELAILDASDIHNAIASAIKHLSSLHDKIMIEQAHGTMDAKRFKKIQRNNTSGSKGVTFNKNAGKWQAKIGNGTGRSRHIGYFETMEQAEVARAKAEAEMWALRN